MSAKPTPWPWEVYTGTYQDIPKDQETVCDLCNGTFVLGPKFKRLGDYVADARLIAAAPLLLKELQHLVNLLEPIEYGGDLAVPGLATLNAARAAIAAARGEA